MEDDEVENFLDRQEQGGAAAGRSKSARRHANGGAAASSSAKVSTTVFKRWCTTPRLLLLLAALTVIVVMYFSMGGGAPDEGEGEDIVKPPPTPDVAPPPSQPSPDAVAVPTTPPPVPPQLPDEPLPSPVAPPPPPLPPTPKPVEPQRQPSPDAAPADAGQPQPSEINGGEDASSSSSRNRGYSEFAKVPPDPDHLPVSDETKSQLTEKWGKWKFYDGDEELRPERNYLLPYENGDMPADDFPEDAWQADAVYVNHIIDAAENLLARAKEAIFTEYGWGKPLDSPDGLTERLKMFKWQTLEDLSTETDPPADYGVGGTRGNGGWTTERSFDGLVRRLLHAIHTSDQFTIVLVGGNPRAAGVGNHFHQSYAMQMHKVLAPIFARLGVQLVTRNMAMPGMGTIHQALGFQNLYGDAIDLLLFDSDPAAFEGSPANVDFLFRQALISGKKVPVIWGGDFDVLRTLHEQADVDVGDFGFGMSGVPVTESAEQAETLLNPVRYIKCAADKQETLCDNPDIKFCTSCWLDREDGISKDMFDSVLEKPPQPAPGMAGWRQHQLIGRVLAFSLIDALQEAVQIWSDGTMGE